MNEFDWSLLVGLPLSYYIIYMVFVVLRTAESSSLPSVQLFIAFFAPTTFVALVVVAIRSLRTNRNCY
jgi:hypothetical protein